MRSWRRRLAAVLVAGSALGAAGCTTPPAGEGPILAFGDIEDDAAIGREQHPRVLAQHGGAYDDEHVTSYVDGIGEDLKNVSELAELDFTFTVLDSDIVNAFALPGGYVYVTRGLMGLAENEAELAGVIGHEIGHVTARHGAARQTTGSLLMGGLTILGVLAGQAVGGEEGARLGGQLGQLGGFGIVQTYSRSQEFEADQLGIRYLTGAGYDPQAMAGFLSALEDHANLQRQLVGAGPDGNPLGHFFSSHPNTPDRVQRARGRAAEESVNGRRGRDALMDVVDGMIFGESPKQGFVLGQEFAHPELRFRFAVPDGFKLQNTPQAVIARGEGRIMVFDMAEADSGRSMGDFIRRDWLEGTDIARLDDRRTGGGFDSAVAEAQVQLEQGPAEGGFVAIRGDGETVYRFMLLTGNYGRGDRRALLDTVDSFRRLSQAEAAELKPQRLRLVTVEPGDTIDSFARRMEVEKLPREHFMVLNGLTRGQELRAGKRVKIVVRE